MNTISVSIEEERVDPRSILVQKGFTPPLPLVLHNPKRQSS